MMIKPNKTCCDKNLQHGMKHGDESECIKINGECPTIVP